MRRKFQWPVLSAVIVIVSGAALAHGADSRGDRPPTYTNARVVSVDVTGRTLVISNARGVEEKLQLDDNLAGFGDVKAGDRVILTLRTGPGWARVSSIAKSREAESRVKGAAAPSAPSSPVDDSQALASREAFGAQVARLADQADRVDRVWNEFRRACNFTEANPREAARGWLAIWETSIRADLSGGFCRDLFNQIVDLGEPVNSGMAAAEDAARRTLSPGEIREIRLQHRMDWDGWGRTSPKRLEQ